MTISRVVETITVSQLPSSPPHPDEPGSPVSPTPEPLSDGEDYESEMANEAEGELDYENCVCVTDDDDVKNVGRPSSSTTEVGNGSNAPRVNEDVQDPETIVEIIKAISYCSPMTLNGDISVTFVARRSDGVEVHVDNETLKRTQPDLLIQYYEKNMRVGDLRRFI